ncbi:MAG: hypothetical protein Q8O67_27700 [Deltaproteobacteria bacterium]|nr:hypothetical protein [Deltaproteobacteria bacterium]
MQIEIVHGDVSDVTAEAVVISANTSLDFEGGAARSLLKSCGQRLMHELNKGHQKRGTVHLGDVVATSAGDHPRLKAILWAVIRDYRPSQPFAGDDKAIVRRTAHELWRQLATLKRTVPLHVALVNLGANEIGASSSTSILLSTLLEHAALHPRLSIVTLVTSRAEDIPGMLVAARKVFPTTRTAGDPTPSAPAALAPVAIKLTMRTTPPPPTTTTTAPAPAGPAATPKKIRRPPPRAEGRARAGTIVLVELDAGLDDIVDLRVDAVVIDDAIALRDGAHVLTFCVRPAGALLVSGSLQARDLLPAYGSSMRATTTTPPASWTEKDFDDASWAPLESGAGGLGLPAGPAEVWVRWRFTLVGGRFEE